MSSNELNRALLELEGKLEEAGLPRSPSNVIGQLFCFRPHDPTQDILIGQVESIEFVDDHQRIELQVSKSAFRGELLECIFYSGGKWKIMLGSDEGRHQEGEFRLL